MLVVSRRHSGVAVLAIACWLAFAPFVSAQTPSLASEGRIFGQPFVAFGYDVKSVLPSRSGESWFPHLYNPPAVEMILEPPSLRPEALAFRNGLLYVAGDWNETQNQIAVFSTNEWGELVFNHSISLPLSTPPPLTMPNNQWWGPEGMTFNTGATGVGAGAGALVTVDDQQAGVGSTFALVNAGNGTLSSFGTVPVPEDIAYAPLSHQFFVLSTPNTVNVYAADMTPTGVSWLAPSRSRGLTIVSPEFARTLTGDQTLTGDILLVICKEDTDPANPLPNRLAAFRADGTPIGVEQDISWVDLALDNSSQSGTVAGPHEMEAIVVDEATGVIYIGDEAARAVYAIKAVTPQMGATQGPVFGRTWQARGQYVELDLPTRNGEPWFPALQQQLNDPPKLRPEGLALRNGLLYASGDWNETQNQIAVFQTAADGTLTFDHALALPVPNPPPSYPNNVLWGPEGLTFNTGATGYGGGGQSLVTVEDEQWLLFGNTRGLINTTTGATSGMGVMTSPDDIAYGPLTQRFYVVTDPNVMRVYSNAPTYLNIQFAIATRAKGAAVISPAFARFLLNDQSISQEVLLVVAKSQFGSTAAPNNRLAAYTVGGALLGMQDLLWTRDAMPGQPLQEFEAVAVDETNQVIYLGDEKAGSIVALTLPQPLSITTPSPLPAAVAGQSYATTIQATGGQAPYTFALTSGALPNGLSLGADGTLSGAPAECGAFNFSVQAADSANPPATASATFDLTVSFVGLSGDMDGNGVRDGDDIGRFVNVLAGMGAGVDACAADMNGDSVVDATDVALFTQALLGNP